jgi:hypothetical protein
MGRQAYAKLAIACLQLCDGDYAKKKCKLMVSAESMKYCVFLVGNG